MAEKTEVNQPKISVVVPVLNEEGSVEKLSRQLVEVLEKSGHSFEVLFIDDGSSDRTLDILKAAHNRDGRVKVLSFRKNFGQTAAIAAGFDYARGEIVVTIDGDLQNDPEDIPLLVKWFVEQLARKMGKHVSEIPKRTMQML